MAAPSVDNLAIDATTAVRGYLYDCRCSGSTSLGKLTTDDIGKTLDYTVT